MMPNPVDKTERSPVPLEPYLLKNSLLDRGVDAWEPAPPILDLDTPSWSPVPPGCQTTTTVTTTPVITTPSQARLRANPTCPLPVLEVLVLLLYVVIVCDAVYVLSSMYLNTRPWRDTTHHPSKRSQSQKCGSPYRQKKHSHSRTRHVSGKKKDCLTLDILWRKLKAEAQHTKKLNSQHRTITQAMMETRLEREKSSNKAKLNRCLAMDQRNIDMVRWASRIADDHNPRVK